MAGETRCYVVTGALGSGAGEIGARLAARLGYFHIDGNLYHSRRSIKKMAAGIALNEHELIDWLTTLSGELAAARAESWAVVLSCSAPRRSHRDILRKGNPDLVFVHGLLDLEPPAPDEPGIAMSTEFPLDDIMKQLLAHHHQPA